MLIVPNFSVGAALAARFAEQAAVWFESIEIVEAHHAGKTDSPSGTAVATAERIAAARADLGPVAAPHTDQRARGQQVGSVPIHSLRLDGVQAKQDVLFGGTGELLTIRHETVSPSAYAAGIRLAVRALPGLDRRDGRPRAAAVRVRAFGGAVADGAGAGAVPGRGGDAGDRVPPVRRGVGIAIGVALLVLPFIGAYLLVRELLFGLQATRLTRRLGEEGPLPGDGLPAARERARGARGGRRGVHAVRGGGGGAPRRLARLAPPRPRLRHGRRPPPARAASAGRSPSAAEREQDRR